MPLPSGIQQPFDSSQGVKRPTKIQFLGGGPVPLPLSEAETSPRVCMNQGAPNVFGAYLELFASTVRPANFFAVNLIPNNGFASWNAEVEIASGLVGFEVAIIPNLLFWSHFPGLQSNESAATFYFPVPIIPTGTRLSSRVKQVQGVVANPLCIELVLISTQIPSAAVSGTITANVNYADIVAGGKIIIITLTNANWVAAGVPFDDERQNIIQGIESDITGVQAPIGWNQVVKDDLPNAQCVRTSDTVVTITLTGFPNVPPPPASTYDGNGFTETITVTVPASALTISGPLTALPTFTVIP